MSSNTIESERQDLDRLRRLRKRADALLRHLQSDLSSFLHDNDKLTFVRTPGSPSLHGDVNVTTTCSCVMALAQSGCFARFYKPQIEGGSDANEVATDILSRILQAPWMSSGLVANNAFTTSLVLRTHGILRRSGVLNGDFTGKKNWEGHLVGDLTTLVEKLRRRTTGSAAEFVYESLSVRARKLVDKEPPPGQLKAILDEELRLIEKSGWIYSKDRFPGQTAPSPEDLTDANLRVESNRNLLRGAFGSGIAEVSPRSLTEIAAFMAKDAANFGVNGYDPAPAVLYWFVDGVLGRSRDRELVAVSELDNVADWAARFFNSQRSLVAARRDATMDPVAMGMAACVCERLRSRESNRRAALPSREELLDAIRVMFEYQHESGIWPKYFPMFHYQNAGSNYCFTFELLEAILQEFDGESIFSDPMFVAGYERAVTWCERNRNSSAAHTGWNSGGDLKTLNRQEPESWATAVVHMFLGELSNGLSKEIRRLLLKKYEAENANKQIDTIMDSEILLPDGGTCSLKGIVRENLISEKRGRSEATIRQNGIPTPSSALLFGPPGTSKTQMAKAIATSLEWPLVVLNPSIFVKQGWDHVFEQTEAVFTDLYDLYAAVVFFDEMDALGQNRGPGTLDTSTQFLVTSMLPKITRLHDERRVVFLMATNYQERFDPAIKRAGRFDLLLCMGPPSLEEKFAKFAQFFPPGTLDDGREKRSVAALESLLEGRDKARFQLQLFTYGDFRAFLAGMGDPLKIHETLEALDRDAFEVRVMEHGRCATLRIEDLPEPHIDKLPTSKEKIPRFDEKQKSSEIARYMHDRFESRIQSS